MRGAAEHFIADKAQIASVLNSLKNNPFYTHQRSISFYTHLVPHPPPIVHH